MALTDIVNTDLVYELDRGNSGILVDITSEIHRLYITVPDNADVNNGTEYGPQDSETGTLVGGGSSGYSRGRIVNA